MTSNVPSGMSGWTAFPFFADADASAVAIGDTTSTQTTTVAAAAQNLWSLGAASSFASAESWGPHAPAVAATYASADAQGGSINIDQTFAIGGSHYGQWAGSASAQLSSSQYATGTPWLTGSPWGDLG